MTIGIEQFATISARLADPFARRDEVLASVGLSQAQWLDLAASFVHQLSRRPELAREFADGYARERQRLMTTPPTPSQPDAMRSAPETGFLSAPLPFRAEAARVPLSAVSAVEATPPPTAAGAPVLPFRHEHEPSVRARLAAAHPAPADVCRELDPLETTQEIAVDSASVTLPFWRVERSGTLPAAVDQTRSRPSSRGGPR